MKIGLIVAIEMDPVFACYNDLKELECPNGFRLYTAQVGENELYVLHTGMGLVAAASGTQYLITRFQVDCIVNYGVVGGLSNEMATQRVCVVDRVVHYRYDVSGFMPLPPGQLPEHETFLKTTPELVKQALALSPDLKVATCCSGDLFVAAADDKAHLHEAFEGDICDMESAGIVLTCEANDVPCLLLKAVADSLAGGAREFYDELLDASRICLNVADQIMQNL